MYNYAIQSFDFSVKDMGTVNSLNFKKACKKFDWVSENEKRLKFEESGEEACPVNLGVSDKTSNLMVMSEDGESFSFILDIPKSPGWKIISFFFSMLDLSLEINCSLDKIDEIINSFFGQDWENLKRMSESIDN